ncbi:uncharacterized protein LOC141536378 [Cotesia typhae]|uniref:uncharacterized protein LOC141536378 n=1 Tax=Cotesia typhae TaxID=2053667 RepID=UPI003D69001F
MQVTTSVLLWALFSIAQIDAKPLEIGSSEVSRTDVTKQQVGDALQTTKLQDVGSSRYRSSGRTRNIYEPNNNNNNNYYYYYKILNQSNFTPGIINNIKTKSSRRSRLPTNWINFNAITSTTVPLLQAKEISLKDTRIRNESRLLHAIALNPLNSLSLDKLKTKVKNTIVNSTKFFSSSSSSSLKSPSKNNEYIFVKPNMSFIVANSTKKKPPKINTTNIGTKTNKTIVSGNKKYPVIKNPVISTVYLKNWPNDPLRNEQDLLNYQKYTSPYPTYSNIENNPVKNVNSKLDKPVLSNKDKPSSAINSWSPSSNLTHYEDPLLQPSVQEIIKWLQIPPFSNHPHIAINSATTGAVSNVFTPSVTSIQPVFYTNTQPPSVDENANDFQLLENLDAVSNNPNLGIALDPLEIFDSQESIEAVKNKTETSIITLTDAPTSTDLPTEPTVIQRPVFRPVSEITQNTVVHIINPLSKKRNVTVSEGKVPFKDELNSPPNVHITFASENDTKSATNLKDTSDNLCPTITINSITKVNNTIQSKQGCTDLNIIINSQLLSTHNFNGVLGGDESGIDKHVNGEAVITSTDSNSTLTLDHPSSVQADPDRNDLFDAAVVDDESESEGPYDVNQESNYLIGDDDDVPSESVFSDGVQNDFADAGPSETAQVISGSSDAVGNSNGGLAGSALSRPSRPGLPNIGNPLSNLASGSNSGGSNGNGGGSGGSTSLAALEEDDDDDDDFDFSTLSVLEGITNVFTYLTVLNPLNYGIFSLAAAPFAALAAGIVGVSAIFFPWAFASGLNFGRAADTVTILFRPSLEDFVKQSISRYQNVSEWKSKRKKNEASGTGVRDFKGYQYIDQSLKTVATQLLNVSNLEDLSTEPDKSKLPKIESKLNLLIRKPDNNVKETSSDLEIFGSVKKSSEINLEPHSFGRPVNSKFGFFQSSHPGQAMAITEEELERELATARTTTHKTPVTTVGGISTWILLSAPSSTLKTPISSESKNPQKVTETKTLSTTSAAKLSSTTIRVETSVKTTVATEKPTPQILPVASALKQTTMVNNHMEKVTMIDSSTTPRTETTESIKYKTSTALPSTTEDNDDEEIRKTTTKKVKGNNSGSGSTTPKSTTIIMKTTAMKVSRPNLLNRSTRPPAIRKPSIKSNNTKTTVNATPKIEKVTFRPVQMITNKNSQAKPSFVSKLQATLHTNSDASSSVVTSNDKEEINATDVKVKTKPAKTNVLKVHLKKPVDSQTTIEIKPIKVNAPVLTIEKVDDKKDYLQSDESVKFKDPIDVKFDFNPELTKIVESSTRVSSSSSVSSASSSSSSSSSTSLSSTTKRPKNKRKKNKLRRRKPSTTLAPSISSSPSPADNNVENIIKESTDISIQESKIVPESKVTNNNNTKTNNKKKQVAKPIGTQIYQFLSREVMPSVGVMSLVGLGLGLASYFLYPFGGTIARRNYEVEPNYKYNVDEYGGNYGQSEEEVLSKVYLGMNNNNNNHNNNNNNYNHKNSKYNVGGNKNVDKNYYRYQAYDGAYIDSYTTRRNTVADSRFSTSAVPVYRPDAPFYDNHYNRDNEFKYPDLPTTPNYYERQTKPQFINSQASGDRKFVVGNIPKEYPYDNQRLPVISTTTTTTTENIQQTDFEKEIAEKLNFVKNPIADNFGSDSHAGIVETSALKADAPQYDDIEITPTAVVVEHGPRAIKLEKLITRQKRESVIQQIPAKSEIEKSEQEDDLSNEILDIIDSAVTEKPIKYMGNEVTGEKEKVTESDKNLDDGLIKNSGDKIDNSELEEVDVKNETKNLKNSTLSNEYLPVLNVTDETVKFNSTTESNENDFNGTLSDSIPTKPVLEKFNFFNFVKTVAEVKLRVGLSILKHAGENFAKYIGNIQKRLNGDQ